MKKLLLIAGILALSTSLMGASAKDTKEGTVKVKAKVVEPLVLSTGDVDFGMLVSGETKEEETEGSVSIKGTPNEQIKFEVKVDGGDYQSYVSGSNKYDVVLKTGNGTANEIMTSKLRLESKDVTEASDGKINLGSKGNLIFKVKGEVTAGSEQSAGEYEGVIHVRAMYN